MATADQTVVTHGVVAIKIIAIKSRFKGGVTKFVDRMNEKSNTAHVFVFQAGGDKNWILLCLDFSNKLSE